MKSFLLFLTAFFTSNFKERRDLALENLALRQQLAPLKRERKRPTIKNRDRLFWVWLSRIWKSLARNFAHRQARNGHRLAAPRLPTLLDEAVAA